MSALRCAFEFGDKDHPEKHNPASGLNTLRITKKDRQPIDSFTIQEGEAIISFSHAGHSIQTMLSTYARWTEGATEADVATIKRAMEHSPNPVSTADPSNTWEPPELPLDCH